MWMKESDYKAKATYGMVYCTTCTASQRPKQRTIPLTFGKEMAR